ncbi:MAG: ABC transporter ATP-binding protein [Ktedonobacteraceae bacterium]|nr:ABC transporter ATP-binding protein [Chloroflexota bacterium]
MSTAAAQNTQNASNVIIKVEHIYKRYRNVDALKDLSLEIPAGSIYGLIGSNGAGKTTLLRILAALLPPSAGTVWFGKDEVSKAPAAVQRKIGYMPDFFGVYSDLSSAEYLEFYAGIHRVPRQKRARVINDLLELVDLTSKRDALVETLSRGMKQRLCLARALVHDPDVLLLDEPASGLDPRARVELRELLRTLQGLGKTIIISSHILLELAEMCTDIAIIQGGRLVVAGDVAEVSQQRGRGRQLEIRALGNISDTIEVLKGMAGISNVVATNGEGELIQLEFLGDDQALQQLLADLIGRGLPIVSFAPRSSGGRLEDVFMNVTEGGSPT